MTAPPLDRREQRKLRTRQQLLDAAKQVFSEHGFHDSSILQITEAANLSKRTFYLHFDDKDDLIETLATQSFHEVHAEIHALEEKLSDTVPMREQHHAMVKVMFEWAKNNPMLMDVILGRHGSFKLNAMTHDYVASAFEQGMGENCEMRDDAPVPMVVIAHAQAGLLMQVLTWWVRNDYPYTPDEIASMTESILYDGLEVNIASRSFNGGAY